METVTRTTRSVLTYTLYVAGLFGRNRTAKRKGFKMAEVDATSPISLPDLQARMKEMIVQLKVKQGAQVSIYENPETVEDRSDGLSVRTFQCFAGQTLLKETVA